MEYFSEDVLLKYLVPTSQLYAGPSYVLVDKWMLPVKPVYKLKNVSDDLKWTTNTHETPFTLTSKA